MRPVALRRSYEGALGDLLAHQLSCLILLLLVLGWTSRVERRHPLPAWRDAAAAGAAWTTVTRNQLHSSGG